MYKKVLIATDGSALAEKALQHGLLLANAVGASVIILTATEMWSALEVSREAARDALHAIDTYESVETERANGILSAAGERAKLMGTPYVTRHVRDRRPSEAILEVARAESCDLIVMATHGRRGFNRALLGSQTNEVVTQCEIPMLILR